MKGNFLIGTLFTIAVALPSAASTMEIDCADCIVAVVQAPAVQGGTAARAETLEPITVVASQENTDGAARPSCDSGLARRADEINQKIRPLREIAGYVRSPQGLAIKLVNDHVMKIPAWVGYAMDPVGSLKNKALDEVRNRAKDAMKSTSACAESADAKPAAADVKVDIESMREI